MTLTAGFGGVSRHACAALADGESVFGVCEQERITRVRGAGVEESGLPDQALDALLAQAHVEPLGHHARRHGRRTARRAARGQPPGSITTRLTRARAI